MSTAAVQQNVKSNILDAQQRALDLWNADREVFGRSQESAKALGAALNEVATAMPHGEYQPWLKRAGIDRNRATYCMRVANGKHAAAAKVAKKKRKVLVIAADTFLRWGGDEQVFTVDGRPMLGEDGRWVLPLTLASPEQETTDKFPEPAVIVDDVFYDGVPKIEFDATELNKALRRFKDIEPIKDWSPLVRISSPATVLFIGKDAALRIRLTKASTFGNFEHLVDFETLVAATKSMTGVVTIMDDGTLKAGDFQTKLTWAPDKDDYVVRHEEPLPDTVDESHFVTGISLATFKEQYKLVDFVIPNPEGTFVCPSALTEATSDSNLRMVTTDGVRLAISEKPARVPQGMRFMIPHPALDLIHKMNGETLAIAETESLYIFTTELETMTHGRTFAQFANYNAVIPINHGGWTRVTCPDAGGFAAALKRLRPFANREKPPVIVEVTNDEMRLSGRCKGVTTAQATVPILKVGPDVTVELDINRLLPFIERVGSFECYIKNSATIVEFNAPDGYRFLLMPMRPDAAPAVVTAPVQEAVTA